MVGEVVTELVIFWRGHKCWPLNGSKLQSIKLLEAVVSPATSSQILFDCINNNHHTPSPTLLMTKTICYFQLALNLCEKILWPISHITSWLASNKTLWRRECNRCSSQIFFFFCLKLQTCLFLLLSVTWIPIKLVELRLRDT